MSKDNNKQELQLELPLDFSDKLNKTVILTGAGFTKGYCNKDKYSLTLSVEFVQINLNAAKN